MQLEMYHTCTVTSSNVHKDVGVQMLYKGNRLMQYTVKLLIQAPGFY